MNPLKPLHKIGDPVWIDDGCKFGKIVGRAEIVDDETRVWHFEYLVKGPDMKPTWKHEREIEAIKK